jgi:AcrR family transcriptional regulator
MSKNNSTKDIIMEKALDLFNEKGIEYVGVREIANALQMRVGNITYYFPTKNDLVAALSQALADLNSKTIVAVEGLSMASFLAMYKSAFENHYTFRCLFISFVHLLQQNKTIARQYSKTQKIRFNTLSKNICELQENGYLKSTLTTAQIEYIVSSISLIVRFWLSEAKVTYPAAPKQQLFTHYLTLVTHQLKPYCTAKGITQIHKFLADL